MENPEVQRRHEFKKSLEDYYKTRRKRTIGTGLEAAGILSFLLVGGIIAGPLMFMAGRRMKKKAQ